MANEEFKGNSNALKHSKTKPVTSNVIVRNESESKKFRKRFFAEDIKTVSGHVINSVLIPNLQKGLSDIVKSGIDYLIYGSKGVKPRSGPGMISYTDYYNRGSSNNTYATPMANTRNTIYAVNDVVFRDRGEAEEVLIRLQESIQNYGMVSVADFYDLINQRTNYTDQKWGWKNLQDVDVIRTGDGYSIRFPRIQAIE